MSHMVRKPVFGDMQTGRFKPVSYTAELAKNIEIADVATV